jgi:Tol biopolymer transport system component
MRADGSHERFIPDTDFARYAAYAPDGERIVLTRDSGSYLIGSCVDIFTISLAGSDRQRLTDNCSSTTPSWQPLPRSP